MMSQMVAYDNMTRSSLLVSLSLSSLQLGSGHQLKTSAALLVLPNLNDVIIKQGKLTEPTNLWHT